MAKTQTDMDENPFAGQGGFNYAGENIFYANKDEYVDKKIEFEVLDAIFEKGEGYKGEDRWVVITKQKDGTREAMTFSSNEGRDENLKKAKQWLSKGKSLPRNVLVLSGRAHYINAVRDDSSNPF